MTLHLQILHWEDAREGGRTVRNLCAKGNCWKRRGSQRSRSLQGSLPHLVASHSLGRASSCSCHSSDTPDGTTGADRANCQSLPSIGTKKSVSCFEGLIPA